MKHLILTIALFSAPAFGFGLGDLIPTPDRPIPRAITNPIPICQSCLCGNQEMCLRDIQNAKEEADRQAAELFRRAAEADRQAREAAEARTRQVITDATTLH